MFPIAIGLGILGLIIGATFWLMGNREKSRKAAREAESVNILSNDTRRAFWNSAADDPGHGGDSSGGDGGGGSD